MLSFIFKGSRNDYQKFLDGVYSKIQRCENSKLILDYLDVTKFLNPDGTDR